MLFLLTLFLSFISVIFAYTNSSSSETSSDTCASLYYQCGGLNWEGSTCCSIGTCVKHNDYYWQCQEDDATLTSTYIESDYSINFNETDADSDSSSETGYDYEYGFHVYTNSTGSYTNGSSSATTADVISTTADVISTSPENDNCVGLDYQCGGIGWAGPTCCSVGTCVESNEHYWKCSGDETISSLTTTLEDEEDYVTVYIKKFVTITTDVYTTLSIDAEGSTSELAYTSTNKITMTLTTSIRGNNTVTSSYNNYPPVATSNSYYESSLDGVSATNNNSTYVTTAY
ncbi:uncharacterized protein ASCRUDRAFT_71385 [Ascoidea rubescens DSM 1968]|uniref:CBM1 domain-containing protein n=1 Tax=Ascoidea rubescens DSM 1968 TaxID=1344418 RepID=A0A1D2VE44_9ASCO|nr:hypothetical protein ASCRUDRAFT_71385 [Ascoidea rubescens DSM 1968]ODV59895.1 hypothetical protein ASCRUDRAFT_71385 [Ascoidea rubescens DSM 1968]